MVPKLFLSLLVILFFPTAFFSQEWAANMPPVLPSGMESHIADLIERHPEISPDDLAVMANERLAIVGFDYEFDPCDLKTRPTSRIFPRDEGGDYHAYDLTGRNGKRVSILAREPGDAPCGCWVNLPVTSITRQAISIVTGSGTQKVRMPKKLLFEEITLVDKTLKRALRYWVAPHGGPPDAISNDGTKLYFEIPETPLYLEIDAMGKLRFVPKTASGIAARFTDLTKFPKDRNNDYLGYRRFTIGTRTMTVKFSHVCT